MTTQLKQDDIDTIHRLLKETTEMVEKETDKGSQKDRYEYTISGILAT